MDRTTIYGNPLQLARRLFTWGLLSAMVFLLMWYFGGINIYGQILAWFIDLLTPSWQISYQSGNAESAAILRSIDLEDGRIADLTFLVNRLNASLIEVVTLLAIWPHRRAQDFWKLTGWCVALSLLYHCGNVILQLHVIAMGPRFANLYDLYWQSSGYYRLMLTLGDFDTLILRHWAGFPIFGLALFLRYLMGGDQQSSAPSKENKGRRLNTRRQQRRKSSS